MSDFPAWYSALLLFAVAAAALMLIAAPFLMAFFFAAPELRAATREGREPAAPREEQP